eukprot:4246305-Amphidinium_carterae.1
MLAASEVPRSEHAKAAFIALQRQLCTSICVLPSESLSLCLAGCDVANADAMQLLHQSLPEGCRSRGNEK